MIKDKTAKHPIIIRDFTSTDCIYPARHKLTGAAYIQNNGFAGCGISLYFIYLSAGTDPCNTGTLQDASLCGDDHCTCDHK